MDLDGYVHALATAEIPQPKELDVTVIGAGTDAVVDELNLPPPSSA